MHFFTSYYVPELKRDLQSDRFHKYEGNVIDKFSALQFDIHMIPLYVTTITLEKHCNNVKISLIRFRIIPAWL